MQINLKLINLVKFYLFKEKQPQNQERARGSARKGEAARAQQANRSEHLERDLVGQVQRVRLARRRQMSTETTKYKRGLMFDHNSTKIRKFT